MSCRPEKVQRVTVINNYTILLASVISTFKWSSGIGKSGEEQKVAVHGEADVQ